MTEYTKLGRLKIANLLLKFVNEEIVPHTTLNQNTFWKSFETLIYNLSPKNKYLLEERSKLQTLINEWHLKNIEKPINPQVYKDFLFKIGYLSINDASFAIGTTNVDAEIASIAGPQLVVPVSNPRYALNAANARWGSLYDALYGTDAIEPLDNIKTNNEFDKMRGEKVILWVKDFLDEVTPLAEGSHSKVTSYRVENGKLSVNLVNDKATELSKGQQFTGFTGNPNQPHSIFLNNNGLHIELIIDRNHSIGSADLAGVADVILESALTTIIDFEDSIAAVDAEDKVDCYRNWLGLMQGTLKTSFVKGSKTVHRNLNPNKTYINPEGKECSLQGRSLMLVRNVGHLMTSDAILDESNAEIPEGILDAVITSMIGMLDFQNADYEKNSKTGSIYIVKPKMHGPQEVAFSDELFNQVEQLLGLKPNTIKMGIMDEERRTTVNLRECIRAAKDRVAFINTGFLDRTGDEIFTSMEAGAVVQKAMMKQTSWIKAYEDWNVDTGLQCGFQGHAQIGKGMWAMPDMMAEMLTTKVTHPKEGANTAWVPSPTAATLHSVHYHQVNVFDQQEIIKTRKPATIDKILTIPLSNKANWSEADIQRELENNAQGILGYVVRWVDQGIGCSKVPDINNIGLMEDRATLRISSQHIGNWLHHGICTEKQVRQTLIQMAEVVDDQNANDPEYKKMSDNLDESIAFKAACDLVFLAREQPSGYTEPILHASRKLVKQLNKN